MEKMVTVLLSTYNGENYLIEQLDSILNQTYKSIQIIVRDDGSTDRTQDILDKYQLEGKLKWYKGDNIKPAWSFMDLIYNAPKSDYYAFCDQDDVWLNDKVKIAVENLNNFDASIPALYYGTPRLVDANLMKIKKTLGCNDYMITFNEMLIESNATGCTMVFNYSLMKLLKNKKPAFIIMHDDWIYKVCLAVSGNIYHDNDVHILYRQHSHNAVGINSSSLKKIKNKIIKMKTNKNMRLNTLISLYDGYSNLMNNENKCVSNLVINYKSIRNKIKIIFNRKIKTKYFLRNVYFRLLILFNLY